MPINKLSVIIPAYNESATVYELLERVAGVRLRDNISMEVLVIDDHSTDDTAEKVKKFREANPGFDISIHTQKRNMGKGAAIHKGIDLATGDFLIIQDADLEYDPEEFNDLLAPVLRGNADVVYGSRFRGGKPVRNLFFWHTAGNKFLTLLSNMATNLNLTDMETCYKMFRSDIIKGLTLKEKRFGFEPEVTAKIARIPGIRIYEVGIAYYGRTYDEGKKINWKDGFRAIYCILKYGVFGL